MKQPKIIIIGPSLSTQGGISSVLCIYKNKMYSDFTRIMIPSYSSHNIIICAIYFAFAIVAVFYYAITGKNIFHFHMASKGSFLRKSILINICLLMKVPIIIHIHGAKFDQFLEQSSSRKKEKIIKLLNSANKVIVLSQKWKRFFSKYLNSDKIEIISNPSSTFDGTYKINQNQENLKIIFTGKIGERKGTYDLIKAIKQISNRSFTLNIYGDGENARLKKMISRYELSNHVKVYNWLSHDQITNLYDNSNLLVLPSYAEGLPMSILEAIGRGLPVIATNVGGIPELVHDGHNGFLVRPGDISSLAKKIEILIENKSLRERMGNNSLKLARKKFSINKINNRIEKLYKSIK